ncbi:MAG: hypothetical protein ACKO7W_19125 [Elainella sp.]
MLNDTSHFLLAQQVMDGLPPPPPGSQTPTYQAQQYQQYMVVVNGNSQILLSQVQAVQPSASVQDYNGQQFIQAGVFSDLTTAQQQVTTLAASGIEAQVMAVAPAASLTSQASSPVTVPSYSSPEAQTYGQTYDNGTLPPPEAMPSLAVPAAPGGEVQFNAPSTQAEPERASDGRTYYVVIPGKQDDLSAVSEQITRLTDGMGIDGMVDTATSRGSHIRVGPFNTRSAANRWTRYFRDFGMDARVSYGG